MPTFKGVRVHVTDTKGIPLREYGTRSLGRASTASCYIESQDKMQFHVTVQPDFPLPPSPTDSTSVKAQDHDVYDKNEEHEMEWSSSSRQHRSHPSRKRREAPAWQLLASVYLDGRAKPEHESVIYMDPDHPDFGRDGKITLDHRWVENEKGEFERHTWEFKECGIETRLERLSIGGETIANHGVAKDENEELQRAIDKVGIPESQNRVGQITVTLTKVTPLAVRNAWEFEAVHRAGDLDDANANDACYGGNFLHTAGLGHVDSAYGHDEPLDVIEYQLLAGQNDPYATFKFYHRPTEVLRKFNFNDFPKAPQGPGYGQTPIRRRIDAELSRLTPLSILYPSISSSQTPVHEDDMVPLSSSPTIASSSDSFPSPPQASEQGPATQGNRSIKTRKRQLSIISDEGDEQAQDKAHHHATRASVKKMRKRRL